MNKNVRNAVILGLLAVVLGYFLYSRVFSESEEDRAFRENLERQKQARESGQPAPAAPGSAAAAASPAASAAPAPGTVIREDEINLEELAAGIKEVEFDYDEARKEEQLRNPMAPLVGPYVVARVQGTSEPGQQPTTADDEAVINAIQRNLLLTGIMWHPTAPVAIINNEVVPLGYTFPDEMFKTARSTSGVLEGSVSVERITRNSVILKYKESEITLELKER